MSDVVIKQVNILAFILTERYGCYTGQPLAPTQGFGQGFFLAPWAKKWACYAILDNFRPFLVFPRNINNIK